MRFLLGLSLTVMLLGGAWNKYITHGGLLAHLDKAPMTRNADRTLYWLGHGYEMVSSFEKMHDIYRRLVDRYPKSAYFEEAQFGLAFALEKLRRFPEALEEYQKYIEAFPEGKYATTVRNNIEILKSR
jgi:TolA-binding protein